MPANFKCKDVSISFEMGLRKVFNQLCSVSSTPFMLKIARNVKTREYNKMHSPENFQEAPHLSCLKSSPWFKMF